jgi:hypothetical protein
MMNSSIPCVTTKDYQSKDQEDARAAVDHIKRKNRRVRRRSITLLYRAVGHVPTVRDAYTHVTAK